MTPKLDRAGRARLIIFAVVALVVATVHVFLRTQTPPPTALVESYDALTLLALEKLETLSEKGLTAAGAIIGALGAVLLGFNKDVRLAKQQVVATSLAVFFCVLSALAGVTLRLRLIEMLANKMSSLLNEQVVQVPLQIQYVCLLAALASAGWLIIETAFASPKEP